MRKKIFRVLAAVLVLGTLIGTLTACGSAKDDGSESLSTNLTEKRNIIYYGHYEQDGISENGAEPISWIVLAENENKRLLLSEYVLDVVDYGGYWWGDSGLREWMNEAFIDIAFTEEEQNSIQKMITSKDTEDYVFSLSTEELRGFLPDIKSRAAKPTQKVANDSGEGYPWWTRSAISRVYYVKDDGCVNGVYPADAKSYGARPVICLSMGDAVYSSQNMLAFGFDSNKDIKSKLAKISELKEDISSDNSEASSSKSGSSYSSGSSNSSSSAGGVGRCKYKEGGSFVCSNIATNGNFCKTHGDYLNNAYDSISNSLDGILDSSGSTNSTGAGGFEMPKENDRSFSDYVKRVAPDLYNDISNRYNDVTKGY